MANKINSRAKGNKFERNIAKWFQKWSGYEFGRVPGSGSLRWKKTDNITGDITTTDPKHARRFILSVECKSYQDIKFEHLLLGQKSCKIQSFWEQCYNDAVRASKVPILVMRYNSMAKEQGYFIADSRIGNYIATNHDISFMQIKADKVGTLYIFLLTEILAKVSYDKFHKFAKTNKVK